MLYAKFGDNYDIGWDMFERSPNNVVSDVIVDIEKGDGKLADWTGFSPSHTWKVISEDTGIEASTEGVSYFPLSKYFNDPSCEILSCHPAGIVTVTIQQMLAVSAKLTSEHMGYDYSGLIGDAIEGVLDLDSLIPVLKKIADPLNDSHDLFCSALVATINKATPQYANVKLFQDYIISKISPLRLMVEFPYDEMPMIKTVDQ